MHTVDLPDDELLALIICAKAMLEGMVEEGSPRPEPLVKAYNKLVMTHNLELDTRFGLL